MDFSHYSDEPVQLAVDLVNTYEGFVDEERLASAEDLDQFIVEHTAGWERPHWIVTERDLSDVRALRSRLRTAITADNAATAAEHLNRILADVSATPRVSVHNEADPHLHFEPADATPSRWLGAIAAMGLSVALIEGGYDRFGVCESATCDDVYVDTSRNRSRRHCSTSCTTRENVAAYRKRQRSEP